MFSIRILVLFMQNVKFLHPIFLGKDPDKGKRNAFRPPARKRSSLMLLLFFPSPLFTVTGTFVYNAINAIFLHRLNEKHHIISQ